MQRQHDSQQFLGVPLLPQPVSVMPEESQPTGPRVTRGPGEGWAREPWESKPGDESGNKGGLDPRTPTGGRNWSQQSEVQVCPILVRPSAWRGQGPHFVLGEGIASPPCWITGKNPGGTAPQCHKVLPRGPKASGLPGQKPARAASALSTRMLSGLGLVAQALWASVSQAIKWCPHCVFHRGCGRVPRGHTCEQPKAGRTPANIPLLLLLLR